MVVRSAARVWEPLAAHGQLLLLQIKRTRRLQLYSVYLQFLRSDRSAAVK